MPGDARSTITPTMDRRHFLAALPALTLAPRLAAQSAPASLKVRGLSQLTLTVSDVGRSLKFYQDLFGMPIQARQGTTLFLRIGSGLISLLLVGARGQCQAQCKGEQGLRKGHGWFSSSRRWWAAAVF